MIEAVALSQATYLGRKLESDRKELGQYFTPAPVANYMASLLNPPAAQPVRILDAGAGSGILTVSALLRLAEMGIKNIHAVLYEIDNETDDLLGANLELAVEQAAAQGMVFTYEIRDTDFILDRPDRRGERFHVASLNPPYFKYNSKTSPYAGATADLFLGNPNAYASFMAVVAACMTDDGQMVAIVPRSFTNGLYFKGFRRYLNHVMSLDKLHIFKARNKVFGELSVLQENVICSYTKRKQCEAVEVRTSSGHADLDASQVRHYPIDLVIDKSSDHEIIRIPESDEEARILKAVEDWSSTFQGNGYFISTGPVVEHRTRAYITTPGNIAGSIPLLRMHNVKGGKVEWTGGHRKDARFRLLDGYEKHVSPNAPYILLKRFSSKDEKRRLVAGVYDPSTEPGKLIAMENHLNYIGRSNGNMTILEATGLCALFNSTLMDKYFRCISGNTQVNATEIRLLKLPARETIQLLGEAIWKSGGWNQETIDTFVAEIVGIKGKHKG